MSIPTPPTLLLAAGGIAMVAGRFPRARFQPIWSWYTLAALIVAGWSLWTDLPVSTHFGDVLALSRYWINDPLAIAEQSVVLTFGLLTAVALLDRKGLPGEQVLRSGFLLFGIAGLMLIARSNDFLSLVLSLEITRIATMSFRRLPGSGLKPRTAGEPEEAIERGALGEDPEEPFDWGWLLTVGVGLGMALLMISLGTTEFDAIKRVLVAAYNPSDADAAIGAPSKLVLLGAGLIVLSLFAWMGSSRFAQSPQPATGPSRPSWCGFSLLALPLAGAISLTRLCGVVFEGLGDALAILMIVLCLVIFCRAAVYAVQGFAPGIPSIPYWVHSMVLLQSAWMGAGLLAAAMELHHPQARWGVFPDQPETLAFMVVLQLTGLLACGGVIWILDHLERKDRGITFLEDLKGLGAHSFWPAAALLLSLLSLAGIPWTAGFWSRWWVLLSGLNVHIKMMSSILVPHASIRFVLMMGIAVTILIAMAVIRIGREVFLELPLAKTPRIGRRGGLLAGLTAALISLVLGLVPQAMLIPLRGMEPPHERLPEIPSRGSGRNHSVFRSSGKWGVELAESSCQGRCARQVRHQFLFSIKVSACSWQSPGSWAQFCPVWSGANDQSIITTRTIPSSSSKPTLERPKSEQSDFRSQYSKFYFGC